MRISYGTLLTMSMHGGFKVYDTAYVQMLACTGENCT